MQLSARVQTRIALVALFVFAVIMAWLLTHRVRAPALPPMQAPKLVDLKARAQSSERRIEAGGSVKAAEVIDFNVEVFEPCYVYVFREQGGTLGLAWGHQLVDESWSPGVYAPEWKDGRGGMPLFQGGKLRLIAMASPFPISDASKWVLSDVENVTEKCPRCGVSSIELIIDAKESGSAHGPQ